MSERHRTVDQSNSKRSKLLPKRFAAMGMNENVRVLATPVKSPSDKKSYRVIRLENGLTALLISDPSPSTVAAPVDDDDDDYEDDPSEESSSDGELTRAGANDEEMGRNVFDHDAEGEGEGEGEERGGEDKLAACALSVRVGSYSDPPYIQGLAHFVEHMVFMGSEKYPVENAFDAFIRKKGGNDNATTGHETTTYHLEIQENHLDEAMDRFAQFFVAPLMRKDSMRRERESVEAEFARAAPSDHHRKDQLVCGLLPAGHPANGFPWGNERSLTPPHGPDDDELHAAAHLFRERHYSAHRMTLAVQARLPLHTLETFVLNAFGRVPNNGEPPDDFSRYAYSRETVTPEFHSFYHVKPSMQTTTLLLTWCMRSFAHRYRSKPADYVTWIINHEGGGSLCVYLQRKVWALKVYANLEDGVDETSPLSLFTVTLELTREGLKNVDGVLDAVFAYLNMLRREGPSERIFNEIREIEDIKFRFKEENQPGANVEELAEDMHGYPPEHYLTGKFLYYEYDPEGIRYVIDSLAPETVNVVLRSQDYEVAPLYDRTEEWFGTEYKRSEIPAEDVSRWRDAVPYEDFRLPDPNPFIPDSFDLIQAPPDVIAQNKLRASHPGVNVPIKNELKLELIPPTLIEKNDLTEIWFKPDFRFQLPYSYVSLYLVTPLTTTTAKTSCLLDLYSKLLDQLLTEKLYAAEATGLTRSITVEREGLVMKIRGYSQKLPAIVDEITQMFNNYNVCMTEEFFNAIKDDQTKDYVNAALKPKNLMREVRSAILFKSYWNVLDRLKALPSVTYRDIRKFGQLFSDQLYVKMLMQGNLVKEDCMQIASVVNKNLRWSVLVEENRPDMSISVFPLGEKYCRVSSLNSFNENSVVANCYQVGISDLDHYCILELLMLIMEEPLFDTLRTKEQLGYEVYNDLRYNRGILWFCITVMCQSSKYSTEYVNDRIENFLTSFMVSTVKNMSARSFEQSKTALIKLKNCVDVDLGDEIERHWTEIVSSEYEFDKLTRHIERIKSLTLDNLIWWLENHLKSGNNVNFRKLSIQIVGRKKDESGPHASKKIKLANESLHLSDNFDSLSNDNLNLNYLNGSDSSVESITDILAFKQSLEIYPKKSVNLTSEMATQSGS